MSHVENLNRMPPPHSIPACRHAAMGGGAREKTTCGRAAFDERNDIKCCGSSAAFCTISAQKRS
jgi:hypothetical protein